LKASRNKKGLLHESVCFLLARGGTWKRKGKSAAGKESHPKRTSQGRRGVRSKNSAKKGRQGLSLIRRRNWEDAFISSFENSLPERKGGSILNGGGWGEKHNNTDEGERRSKNPTDLI